MLLLLKFNYYYYYYYYYYHFADFVDTELYFLAQHTFQIVAVQHDFHIQNKTPPWNLNHWNNLRLGGVRNMSTEVCHLQTQLCHVLY